MAERTIGQRLRAARKAARLTLQKVGDELDLTPQSVAAWETDKHLPTVENLLAVAKLTGTSPGWILTGRDNRTAQPAGVFIPEGGTGRGVPKLMYDEVPQHLDGTLDRTPDLVMSHYPCGPRSFQLPVADRANEPTYLLGDSLIIDPDQSPQPGSMVLASFRSAIVVRKFRPHGNVIELVPVNPDWPIERGELGKDVLIYGVVTERSTPSII